jgi:hypothetical protein
MSTAELNDHGAPHLPVSRESLQAVGKFFVGHMVFHSGSEDGPPVRTFGSDWNEARLSKKEAQEIVRAGMSHEWAGDIAEKVVSTGAAMLHFYLVEGPGGKAIVSVDDCDPRCPATADARALLSPPMGAA